MQTSKRETPDIQTSTDDYAGRFHGPVGTWMLDVQWDAIHKLLRTCPGRQVLELGGGHAQLTGALLDHGYHVTVLGSDESCAHRLKPFLEPGRCAFHTGDLLNLPYEDKSFDTVIAIRLMAHIRDWPRFLAEAGRVARHTVIIDYPTIYSCNVIERMLFGIKKAVEGNTRSYYCYTTREIHRSCASAGFIPSGRARQFFLPMVLHRAMKMPKLSRAMESACHALGLTALFGSPVVLKLVRSEQEQNPAVQTLAAAGKLLVFTHWG